jgi:hypothetical protein
MTMMEQRPDWRLTQPIAIASRHIIRAHAESWARNGQGVMPHIGDALGLMDPDRKDRLLDQASSSRRGDAQRR